MFLRTVLPAVVDHTRLVHLDLQEDRYQSDDVVLKSTFQQVLHQFREKDVTHTSGLVRPSGLYRTLPPGKGLDRLEL